MNQTITDLLEKREALFDIAAELYGPLFVTNTSFWDSPTEVELREVHVALSNSEYKQELDREVEEGLKELQKFLTIKLPPLD